MKHLLKAAGLALALSGCQSSDNELAGLSPSKKDSTAAPVDEAASFSYVAEQFADLRVLRYEVKDFDHMDLKTKTLLYYLYEAALSGRDIIYDQNYKHNLAVRKTLEAIFSTEGIVENDDYHHLETYAKRVWFSNGIHHHYNHDKIVPNCPEGYFRQVLDKVNEKDLPLQPGQSKADFVNFIVPVVFDPAVAPKRLNNQDGADMIATSSVNFYEGVTEKEASAFYEKLSKTGGKTPPSFGLNSKLMKQNGQIVEKVWKVGGMYSPAIEKIVYWLEKASTVAENAAQKEALVRLVKFYRSGELKDFDDYNLAWIKDTASTVDVVNGFIENYHDPLSKKGTFESVVSVKDFDASKRIAAIGAKAQWFEDNSPILPQHKSVNVKCISAKVINAVVESGDAAPSTPIGINLPNSDWIRELGSKSVNLGNIVEAYEQASGGSVVDEFFYTAELRERAKTYGALADKLHTDMHEVIGHASGKLEDNVTDPQGQLKSYYNALEEGRADLVALYYLLDPKLIELGVMPSLECGKAAYDDYITNALLVQLARIRPGNSIEEAHMRNRKMVAEWVFEKGAKDNVVSRKTENGKTFFVVNDYTKLRVLFGELLKEIQRIKSQADKKAGRDLIENYGVKIDPALHKEVLERYAHLNIAPYAGFIQPRLTPVEKDGKIIDVKIEYPADFKAQMLEYGRAYGLLPVNN